MYPLHSTVTLEEQHGVFLSPIPGYRKVHPSPGLLSDVCVTSTDVFSPPQVILSTNIAESSVTVPDVKYGGCRLSEGSVSTVVSGSGSSCCLNLLCSCRPSVIDFCLTRRLVCDQDTNYRSLRLTWTSKTNCNQRRGAHTRTRTRTTTAFESGGLPLGGLPSSHHMFFVHQVGQVGCRRATATALLPEPSGRMTSRTT